ncbi:MAG: nucleotide exchange factor GrpE [Gemmatimonadetes bacterium]|nr:nucleotide exchange factor GrpE [Gemmatimonadota bacterium]
MGKEEEATLESAASAGDATEVTGATAEESDSDAGANHGADSGNGTTAGADPATVEDAAAGADPAASENSTAEAEDPSGEPASGTEAESGEPSDGVPVDEDEDEQARLAEEVLRYKERLVRLAAEFDNYKKRTGREFTALVKNAGESLITELLPILDNIERALQAPQTSDETRSFAQGFEMIRQQFLEKMERAGMKEIAAEGTPFDPTRHEAVMAVENEEHPADTVINVVEKGYTLNEKVLRAAKVIVTRAPAKSPANSADQTDQAETENHDGN